jgi:hypothetical protein
MKMIWLSELNCHMYFYFVTFLRLYAFKFIINILISVDLLLSIKLGLRIPCMLWTKESLFKNEFIEVKRWFDWK